MIDEALPEPRANCRNRARIQATIGISDGLSARSAPLNLSRPHGFAVRPIRPDRARRAAGEGRARGRRRCRRRGCDALGVAIGRRARRRGRGIASAPKATTWACAFWSAGARRWSRPTTSAATASRRWPSARWRWRASRPRTASPASPIRRCWRGSFPTSICSTRTCPTVGTLEQAARRAEAAGLAVKGVSKSGGASASAGIGGMVLVTSHGFSGAYLGSRHGVSMQAIAGEGTAHGERLRFLLGAARAPISKRPNRSAAPPASARWRGSTRARSRPARCRWCSTRASRAR